MVKYCETTQEAEDALEYYKENNATIDFNVELHSAKLIVQGQCLLSQTSQHIWSNSSPILDGHQQTEMHWSI